MNEHVITLNHTRINTRVITCRRGIHAMLLISHYLASNRDRTPKCAAALEEYIPLYLDQDCYKVVLGGVPETKQLRGLP